MSKRTASEAELEERSDHYHHLPGKALRRYIPKLDKCVQEQTDLPTELAHLIVDFVTPKELIDWVAYSAAVIEEDGYDDCRGYDSTLLKNNPGFFEVAKSIFKQLPLRLIWFDDRFEMVLDRDELSAGDLPRLARLRLLRSEQEWVTYPCGTEAMTLIIFTKYMSESFHEYFVWFLEWMTADWLD
jgi:hypothetical protein